MSQVKGLQVIETGGTLLLRGRVDTPADQLTLTDRSSPERPSLQVPVVGDEFVAALPNGWTAGAWTEFAFERGGAAVGAQLVRIAESHDHRAPFFQAEKTQLERLPGELVLRGELGATAPFAELRFEGFEKVGGPGPAPLDTAGGWTPAEEAELAAFWAQPGADSQAWMAALPEPERVRFLLLLEKGVRTGALEEPYLSSRHSRLDEAALEVLRRSIYGARLQRPVSAETTADAEGRFEVRLRMDEGSVLDLHASVSERVEHGAKVETLSRREVARFTYRD